SIGGAGPAGPRPLPPPGLAAAPAPGRAPRSHPTQATRAPSEDQHALDRFTPAAGPLHRTPIPGATSIPRSSPCPNGPTRRATPPACRNATPSLDSLNAIRRRSGPSLPPPSIVAEPAGGRPVTLPSGVRNTEPSWTHNMSTGSAGGSAGAVWALPGAG